MKNKGKGVPLKVVSGLRLMLGFGMLIASLWGVQFSQAASIVQSFYVPITEPEARTWMRAQTATAEADVIRSVISLTGTNDGTTIYYDHWEDGYEDDITSPQQSTTEVFTINAGQVMTFEEDIPVPNGIRDQGNLYHDGMDKISTTQQIVVTRALWPNGPPQAIGAQLAGAVEVFETSKWGTSFEVPAGTDIGQASFNYTALSIMAQKNGTVVTVQNRDLSINITQVLNEGQTLFIPGSGPGIRVGATVTATGGPVQVDLLTAQSPSTYDGRLYSLLPIANLGNTYYSPVSTTQEGGGAMVNINLLAYNPNAAAITVNVACMAGTVGCPAAQVLAAHTHRFFQLPLSPTSPNTLTGARLTSAGGQSFYAMAVIDMNNTVHNWGFNMIPETSLTTSGVVGWSPGTTNRQRDANPIWVTPVATTTIYVDYDGDRATGPLVDPLGNRYDVSYNVQALQSRKMFSPGPAGSYDHAGWRVYTVDNTRIAIAYGQDGASSSSGQPTELDLGTTVLPFPSLVAYKSVELVGDFNNNGGIDPGELLEYTIRVHNNGIVPISTINLLDMLDTNTTYVANTTYMGGAPISDDSVPPAVTRFPLDESGYNLPSTLQPNQELSFTFQTTVNDPLNPPGTSELINRATVQSVAEVFLNTRDSIVQQGILQIQKASSIAPNKVKPGDNIDYTITITNTSISSQTGIQITDSLPDGTSYVANSTTATGHRQKLVMDRFNALSYANNDGPENWAANWSESDAVQDPLAGNIRVTNGMLRLTATGAWASRRADLTTGIPGQNFTSATLTLNFRTNPNIVAGDAAVVEISSTGGAPFTVLETITGIAGQTSATRSYNISAYISANTTVRFRLSAGYTGAADFIYFDNVTIRTNELPVVVTKDNIPGGANPDLLNGVPPTLVRQDDGFSLATGETMTVTYRVRANDPVNETRIVNTATVTSYEKAPPASSTTLDPVSAGGAIGDLVWLDTIPNAVHDTGEPGLYNIRVWLDANNNGIFDPLVDFETYTGTDGKYLFDQLVPGTYRGYVDESTLPPGLIISTGNNPTPPMVITDEEQFLGNDFGYMNAGPGVAIIGDYVWSDANNNGTQDPGEIGLGGITMQLVTSPGGSLVATTTTNAFGIYLFTNVAPGTYVVKSDTTGILAGYTPSVGPQSIGKKDSDPITVTGGNSYVMMDFGYYNSSLYSISNRVWFDLDDNASADPGEPGIKSVTVTLLNAGSNVVGATTSDVYGNFSFAGVPNGNYTIVVEDAEGKLIGYAGTTSAAQAGRLAVTVFNANVSGASFGYNAPGRIGDTLWRDYNNNGIQETGEPGIAGVTVQLYKDTNGNGLLDGGDALVDTKVSDADGQFLFQVNEAGRFFVSVADGQSPLNGLVLTTNDDQPSVAGAQRTVLFLNLATSDVTADFGYNAPGTSAITGLVWNDNDSDTVQDTGEIGISGVTAQLYRETSGVGFNPAVDTLVDTKTTDSGGYYSFQVSQTGTYYVSMDTTQPLLASKTLTTTDDWPLIPGAQRTVIVAQLDTNYSNNDFGFVTLASDLSVTKTANPAGTVTPGQTITYTITIANTSATVTQTGITVSDPLPTYTTYVSNSTVVKGAPSNNTISSVTLYAVKDTYLDQFNPTFNYGGVDPMSIQYRVGRMRRPLAQFDLSTILSSATVGSAFMEFYVSAANANLTANAYGLTRDWNEGTANPGAACGAGNGNGATWNRYDCVNNWTAGGGDYANPPLLGSFVVNPVGYRGINTANLLTLVQGWVTTPANNHGVILAGTAGATQTASIGSRSSANRERLTVGYDTKTNRAGDLNPLANGAPPNLLMPADGFSLSPGESMTVTYQVTVNNPLAPGVTQILNEATVSSNQSGARRGSVTNDVDYTSDLAVTKAIQSIDSPCRVGTCQVTYVITVANVGTVNETGVQVTDVLPAELEYLSDTPSQGSYNSTTGVWTVENINTSSSATLQITAGLISSSPSIQNCASLTASTPSDSNSSNDSSCTGFTPTHVVLSDFRGYEEDGRMMIEWTTSSEIGTAGFYLFRKDDATGGYQQINHRILPALFTSPQGGTYSLMDDGASPGRPYTYLLMEIEAKEGKNIYGPITIRPGGGRASGTLGLSHAINADLLLRLGQTAKGASGKITRHVNEDGTIAYTNGNRSGPGNTPSGRDLYSNYTRRAKQSSEMRGAVFKASSGEKNLPVQTVQDWAGRRIKLTVTREGLYYLSASDIAEAIGLPERNIRRRIRHHRFSLSTRGQKVAYAPTADHGGLLFYGQGLDSIYTKENIYWLSLGKGIQIGEIDGEGPAPAGEDLTFTEIVHTEEDRIIAPVLFKDTEADYWFWDVIVGDDPIDGMKAFSVHVPDPGTTPALTTSLAVNLHGFTDTKHHVLVSVNGSDIGEDAWEGAESHTVVLDFDPGLLQDGTNSIAVRGVLDPEVPYSLFLIDSFDLVYGRLYRAYENALICHGDGNPAVTINGFSGEDILLLDVTDPLNPIRVSAATIAGTNGTYSVSFHPTSAETPYLAVLREAASPVARASASKPAGLLRRSNKADYLIITLPEFEEASRSLAKYRKKQGLKTEIVFLEDIMNEFNDGIYDPRAIRSFLTYAYYHWMKPPRYVVLVGNGTYDYKDNLGHGDNIIPTLMVETVMGLSASDSLFAVLDDDPVPKIAVGRLPVLTAEELQTLVQKIRDYENEGGDRIARCGGSGSPLAGLESTKGSSLQASRESSSCESPISSENRVLLLADDPDDGGNFPEDSDDLAIFLPQRYTVEKIYLSQYPVEQAQRMLLEGIHEGAVFLNYIGHGGPDRLASEGLLTKENISSMIRPAGLHVLAAMTCIVGQYAIPGYDSLSESLVMKREGGSAAVWAPTGFSFNSIAKVLDEAFLKAAFDRPQKVLGDAILEAFQEYHLVGGQDYMMYIYNLLGDPALRLR
jgi:uncharacterized repeat protein (TIGR01451 family)